MTVATHNNTKGLVRAFDVKSGKLLWTFNTIPRPGEFGNDTWENESWAINGNTGVWSQITVDEEAGLRSPAGRGSDVGLLRRPSPGNNLFGDSIVCVDLKTGQRKWHYQIVHHPIWDYDMSSAPILLDANVNGKLIKAVAVPSKQSYLYVFDRITGQPIWPIEERPVQQSDVPMEKTSPTQPFPTKPPAYGRPWLKVPDDLIDFTPAMRAQALENLKNYRVAGMYNPPLLGKTTGGLRGAINVGNASGGTNWPGAGADPETHTVYAQAAMAFVERSVAARDAVDLRVRHEATSPASRAPEFREALGPGFGSAAGLAAGRGAGARARRRRQAAMPAAAAGRGGRGARRGGARRRSGAAAPPAGGGGLQVEGLPIVKPPYGVLAAIDLDKGELKFQVPHGDTPDNVRTNPALAGHEHSEDRPERQRRLDGHQDRRRARRSAGDRAARTSARRDAARLRQEQRHRGRRGLAAGRAERIADDLHGRRQAVTSSSR